jgi:hypothetical protein
MKKQKLKKREELLIQVLKNIHINAQMQLDGISQSQDVFAAQ